MIRRLLLIFLVLLAFSISSEYPGHLQADANARPLQQEDGPTISPAALSVELCGDACSTETIRVTFPPRDILPVTQLDALMLLDISGSMNDVIDEVTRGSYEIADGLRSLVADTRFGAGVFSDYDDIPWERQQDFTADLDVLNRSLDAIEMQGGGDQAESYTRALWEASQFAWRENAVRLVILFTDAPPHRSDRGRDGRKGTADDLEYDEVLAELAAMGIRIIGVNSSGSSRLPDLQEAAEVSDGAYFELDSVEDIPETVVALVEGELRELQSGFVPINDDQEEWISLLPESFDYPNEGGTIDITFTLCPEELGLKDGSYTLDMDLQSAGNSQGTLPVALDYRMACIALTIADTPADTGKSCTNTTHTIFWDSPSIVIRHTADNVYTSSEDPIPGQMNYVYVKVANLAEYEATDATVTLYDSPSLLETSFPGNWREIGQIPTGVSGNEAVWVGPFSWLPEHRAISLRAQVDSVEDPITQPESFACDGNIAQRNILTGELPVSSVIENRVTGFFVLDFNTTGLADTPTLTFASNDLPENSSMSFVPATSPERVRGGEESSDGIYTSDADNGPLTLQGWPSGRQSGELSIQLDKNLAATSLHLRLESGGDVVSGATIHAQNPIPLAGIGATVDLNTEADPVLPIEIPIGISIVLAGVLLISVIMGKARGGKDSPPTTDA